MKKYSLAGFIFLFLFSLSVNATAQTDKVLFTSFTSHSINPNLESKFASRYVKIEANYLAGLSSTNAGVLASSIYFVGEMKSEKALLPLMRIFRETKSDEVKLLAAWSLLKIGNSRGTHLVKWEVNNGENKNIKEMLEWLYNDYSLKAFGKIE
jgi:hypothetical protein